MKDVNLPLPFKEKDKKTKLYKTNFNKWPPSN